MLRLWSYDIAREQRPDRYFLDRIARTTLDGGYDALGLYLEHRFAYPSTPWTHGDGVLTPDDVAWMRREYPGLRLIPFLNLLGHFEGTIYTEEGSRYACERFAGMQADPTLPEFVDLCGKIIDDALKIFDDEIVHIGGDETWQLGQGVNSEKRVKEFAEAGVADPKAKLYGDHFGPLAERVKAAGRRPGVWGDMFFDHPDALASMPKETIIFDWQYFTHPLPSCAWFAGQGYDVVVSPTIHTYNALWCHLPQTERNVREAVEAATALDAYGVCVTNWENALFGNVETLLPVVKGLGRVLHTAPETVPPVPTDLDPATLKGVRVDPTYADESEAPQILKAVYEETGEAGEEWARIMGIELQKVGGTFAFSGHRSKVKSRAFLYSNPFLLYLRDREEFGGDREAVLMEIWDRAGSFAQGPSQRGVTGVGKLLTEFIRQTGESHREYAAKRPGGAAAALAPCRQIFDDLRKIATATELNAGGSKADAERCHAARRHVETVIARIKAHGDGSLGYLPSFETITHPKFVPHDQANWWLINRWGNE